MEKAVIGVMIDVSGYTEQAYFTKFSGLDRATDAGFWRFRAILATIISIVRQETIRYDRQESVFTCAFGFANFPHMGDLIHLLKLVHTVRHQSQNEMGKWDEALEELKNKWSGPLTPTPIQKVSGILDDLLSTMKKANLKELYQKILSTIARADVDSTSIEEDLYQEIFPLLKLVVHNIIFGESLMCGALKKVEEAFTKSLKLSPKVLFVLSSGKSDDGDPREIVKSHSFCSLSITVVSCYLTADSVHNPKQLIYEPDPSWKPNDGRRVLFEMSSTMKNTHTPVSYLSDAGWDLPESGESRLFIQVSSFDAVNEVCKLLVSQMYLPSDSLVDLLGKVQLATYINQAKDKFKPAEQEGGTCYANAIAATFHLSMHRIIGREGGVPSFDIILQEIIALYGADGASTERVLEDVCSKYRLHFCKTDERGARQSINKRRVLVATFSLCDQQWEAFSNFYEKAPKEVLQSNDLPECVGDSEGHAVVLIGCDPHCLTFMNSWGQDFADGGFFRVKDERVLGRTRFFDVYWTLDDLLQSEKEAYERESIKQSKELLEKLPSLKNLPCKCPKCHQVSTIGEFKGHVLEAQCPLCHQKFKPEANNLEMALYCQAHNL